MADTQPHVDVHEERLVPTVVRRPYRRVRIAKRVVTEQQTITVDVRREELVVEDLGVEGVAATEAPASKPEPLVLVLSREVPAEVVMRTEPVEVVRVHVDRTTQLGTVSAPVRHEEVDVAAEGGATLAPPS
jgi:uncharacterized protein (TIGR02271 family)